MSLTTFQRRVCHLIAEARRTGGESYVAGGVALNEVVRSTRVSDDIDLFHDTEQAVEVAWASDRALFEKNGLTVTPTRERPGLVEAIVSMANDSVLVQWARDSAFRFFPLVEHPEFGLTLHPFDLATNKVLALVGRAEVRDWIDALACHDQIQPIGYLAWAASGKDPGFGPAAIVEEAARANRYSELEVSSLRFDGETPSAAALSRRWHAAIRQAREIVEVLPADRVGTCVQDERHALYTRGVGELVRAVNERRLAFRSGSLRGAFPTVRSA